MDQGGPRSDPEPAGPGPAGSPRATWLGLLAVLLLATGLRLARLAEVVRAPDFAQPAVDAAFHDWWARSVAGLHEEADPDRAGLLERAYLRPPGYPLVLAAVYALSDGSYLAARWLQLGLGVAAAVLLAWVLVRARSPLAGLIGGAALGSHWLPLYFEGELQATSLAVFLLVASTGLYLAWYRAPGPWRAAALGLTLGMAAVVRPNALFVLVAALGLLCLELRRLRRPVLRQAGALALGAALAILPVTVRNWRVSGEPVLISTNAGINLFIGNNPKATGLVAAHLEGLGAFETCFDYPALVRRVEKQAGAELSDREVSAWFSARAFAWIAAEPGQALALTARKALLLLGPHEVSHNKELHLERSTSAVLSRLPFPFALLLAGALVGFAVSRRRPRSDPARALASFALAASLAWLASVLPFFVAARYRVPVLPWLTLLAALGLEGAVAAARAGRWRSVAAGSMACAALWAVLSIAVYRPQPDRAKWHHDRGRALILSGREAEALDELDAALAADPGRHAAELSRANALAALGRRDEAVAGYRRVLERRPNDQDALNNLAVQLAESGQLQEAVDLFERALARSRAPGPLHMNLGRALERLGRPEQARTHYERALELSAGGREARRALKRLENRAPSADDGGPAAGSDS